MQSDRSEGRNSGNGKLVRWIWRIANCEFDELSGQFWVNGESVKLPPKPQAVLLALLKAPGHRLTRPELWEIWGTGEDSDQSLSNAVSNLRQAISPYPEDREKIIRTLHGAGFQIVVPVERRQVEEFAEGFRFAKGDTVPGKREWVLTEALDAVKQNRVWLAENSSTRYHHVFKFAADGEQFVRLQREVEVWESFRKAKGDLSGFVQVGSWRISTKPYLLETEYAGNDMVAWAEEQRLHDGLSPELCLEVMADLADAVAESHRRGILHNSIRPSNVLIAAGSDRPWKVKLSNFGVATGIEDNPASASGESLPPQRPGTQQVDPYKAPELKLGSAPTRASDIYALGVLLFQLLCGDFRRLLTPDWEQFIESPILRQDIIDATNSDSGRRPRTASDLADRLRSLVDRTAQHREMLLELEQTRARAEKAERKITARNARRPVVVALFAILIVGLVVTFWQFRRAVNLEHLAQERAQTLQAMNQFVTHDLIEQGNPLVMNLPPGSGLKEQIQKLTLLDAIRAAVPQISIRFANSPAVAAEMHEAIAASLDARTSYEDSYAEFAEAARCYRLAEGPLSQRALIAELRGDQALLRESLPSSREIARQKLAEQEKIIAQINNLSPELGAWHNYLLSGIRMLGPHPADALSPLNEAIRQASSIKDFNPRILDAMKARLSAVYLGVNNGQGAESAAREVIADIKARSGESSPELDQPYMFLQEALDVEGKYQQALDQGRVNYPLFAKLLGPENGLTQSALYMIAQDESQLGNYEAADRDLLMNYGFAGQGSYLAEDSLTAAALAECHGSHFDSGTEHARQAVQESNTKGRELPMFANIAEFTIGECLLAQQEAAKTKPNPSKLAEAAAYLNKVNLQVVSQTFGLSNFEGAFDAEQARLAYLQGDREKASQLLTKGEPFLAKPDADVYERALAARLKSSISQSHK